MAACTVALCACTADVFTGADAATDGGAGGGDGSPSDAVADVVAQDAVAMDGPVTSNASIQCNNGTCDNGHVCCTDALWSTASCQGSSVEGQATCLFYLACDDSSDCQQGQVCCATYSTTASTNVTKSVCADSCTGANQAQLCTSGGECGGRSCVDWTGSPSWLKVCQ